LGGGGRQKKKHKSLPASVAAAAAASSNFHTLNIYLGAVCVCGCRRWFSIVFTFSIILLISTKDKRLGGLCGMIIAGV
jgi:hypothetical protein